MHEDYPKSELLKQYSHVVLKKDSFHLPFPSFFDAKKKINANNLQIIWNKNLLYLTCFKLDIILSILVLFVVREAIMSVNFNPRVCNDTKSRKMLRHDQFCILEKTVT